MISESYAEWPMAALAREPHSRVIKELQVQPASVNGKSIDTDDLETI